MDKSTETQEEKYLYFVRGYVIILSVRFDRTICRRVGMADEADSKSVVGNYVRVQVPLPALYIIIRNETAAKVDSQFAFATVFFVQKKADNSLLLFYYE